MKIFKRKGILKSIDLAFGVAGLIFEPHPQNFAKLLFFKDLQMILVPCFEIFDRF